MSKVLKFILFADDTNIFYTDESEQNLLLTINTELCKLNYWFRVNKLYLNVSKTNYMIFAKNMFLLIFRSI